MSLLFALALTAIQSGDRYIALFNPTMGKPAPTTLRVPYGHRVVREHARPAEGAAAGHPDTHFEHVRIVVPQGQVLSPTRDTDWTAYSYESRHRPPKPPRMVALGSIFFVLTMGLMSYLRRFGNQRLRLLRVQSGLLVVTLMIALLAKSLLLFTSLSEFWIPIAAVPLWIATGFDRRTAFVVTVVVSFLLVSLLEFDLVLLCVLLARGMSATLLYINRRQSRHMVLAGTLSGLCAVALYVALIVMFEGQFDWKADLLSYGQSQLIGCLGGGILSGFLGAVFAAPAARLLGQVPRERLVDLSDLEQPLLLRLARAAPGTYEHSRSMANLAEQAASAIGADALLTRVGAYYHDLGKTTQPKYFVENLGPEERSPHDELDPEVSADAIMAHVVLGAKVLRDGGIPEPVVEFAYTHHGTQLVEYFWNKCVQAGNPKDLDPSAFRYPGMRPQTRETAIVMLVDSIEAASRTIDPPEREAFESMIQRIVFTKLKDGQLDDSALDMQDLNVIVNRMADTLVNMHHHRIKYQWQAKRAQEFGVPSTAVSVIPPIPPSSPLASVAAPQPDAFPKAETPLSRPRKSLDPEAPISLPSPGLAPEVADFMMGAPAPPIPPPAPAPVPLVPPTPPPPATTRSPETFSDESPTSPQGDPSMRHAAPPPPPVRTGPPPPPVRATGNRGGRAS